MRLGLSLGFGNEPFDTENSEDDELEEKVDEAMQEVHETMQEITRSKHTPPTSLSPTYNEFQELLSHIKPELRKYGEQLPMVMDRIGATLADGAVEAVRFARSLATVPPGIGHLVLDYLWKVAWKNSPETVKKTLDTLVTSCTTEAERTIFILPEHLRNQLIASAKPISTLWVRAEIASYISQRTKPANHTQTMNEFTQFLGNDPEQTINAYEQLTRTKRRTLFRNYQDPLEAGIVLRTFGTSYSRAYKTLATAWKAETGSSLHTCIEGAEERIKTFAPFFKKLDEHEQKDIIRAFHYFAFATKILPRLSLSTLIDQATGIFRRNPAYFPLASGFEQGGVPRETAFTLAEKIGRKDVYSYIHPADKPTWIELATKIPNPRLLTTLSAADFFVVAQAYHFATEAQHQSQFLTGLQETLAAGTTRNWAKTIVDYFRNQTANTGKKVP